MTSPLPGSPEDEKTSTPSGPKAEAGPGRSPAFWSRLVVSGRRRPFLAAGAGAVVVALLAAGIVLGSSLASAEADATGVGHGSTAAGEPASEASPASSATKATKAPAATKKPVASSPKPATPEAVPTYAVDPKPEPVLAVDCAGLVAQDLRVKVLGDSGTLSEGNGRPAREDGFAAEWQAGLLRCFWFGAGERASLEVELLPDAIDGFREFSNAGAGASGSAFLGADSRLDCTATTPTSVWSCRGGFTPAGHWVEFNFGGASAYAGEPPYALAGELGASIRGALDAAGPSRPRADTGDAPDCGRYDTAGLRKAVVSPDLAAPTADAFGITMTEVAWKRVGFGICHWTGPSAGGGLPGVTIGILPGGGWAVPEPAVFAAEHPTGDTELVAIAGVQAAVRTCYHDYGQCEIRASVDGDYVTVSTVTPTSSGRDAEADVMTAARFLIANLPE
ncbi:hypothetical protein ACDF64_14745 [Agromyces sp. MMS24-JH15]|uniref:hypothetical protein n=1 Tax=Agromyces sp. MMS24-JH15 TaxID=3243765 RepID=UPI0037489FFA